MMSLRNQVHSIFLCVLCSMWVCPHPQVPLNVLKFAASFSGITVTSKGRRKGKINPIAYIFIYRENLSQQSLRRQLIMNYCLELLLMHMSEPSSSKGDRITAVGFDQSYIQSVAGREVLPVGQATKHVCHIGVPHTCQRIDTKSLDTHSPAAQGSFHSHIPFMACSCGCRLATLQVALVLLFKSFSKLIFSLLPLFFLDVPAFLLLLFPFFKNFLQPFVQSIDVLATDSIFLF